MAKLVIREQSIVDGKGKPTAVILDIQKYRSGMLSLVQEKLDRKESKLLSQSKHFKKLVQKGLRDIEEDKTRPWKEVWDEL
jgi:hypothetical protein